MNIPTFAVQRIIDKDKEQYLSVVSNLIYCLSIKYASKGTLHPRYDAVIEQCKTDAVKYASSTRNVLQKDTLQALLYLFDPKNLSIDMNPYIDLDLLDTSLAQYEDISRILPKAYYYPLLSSLTKQVYIGEAVECFFDYSFEYIHALMSNTIRLYDSVDSDRLSSTDTFYRYISGFQLGNYTFDDICMMLSRHATPNADITNRTFAQLCRMYLTKGICIDDDKRCIDAVPVIRLLSMLSKNSTALDLANSSWFSLLHTYIDVPQGAFNYLMKDDIPHERTLFERDAFRASWLSSYPVSTFIAGIEALDGEDVDITEGGEEDEVSDDSSETTEEEDNISEGQEETPEESEEPEEESEDESEANEPTSVIEFDLSVPTDESAEDKLYKEIVCRKVSEFRKDPPDELSQEELLLLMTWCNQWIFLVGADATKALLGQMAIAIN